MSAGIDQVEHRLNYIFSIANVLQPCGLVFDDLNLIISEKNEYSLTVLKSLMKNLSSIYFNNNITLLIRSFSV